MSPKALDLNNLFGDSSEYNDRMFNALLKALKSAHQEGFDYIRYRKSIQELIKLGMDESTAIKSAFVTASTMGLNKEKLLESIQHYKSILGKEREQFAMAMKNQIANQVDGIRVNAVKMEEKVLQNEQKIQKLEEENRLLRQRLQEVDSDIKSNQEKIENTRDEFKKVFDFLYDHITEDEHKVNSLL
jgi:chromosome segregation ATPase